MDSTVQRVSFPPVNKDFLFNKYECDWLLKEIIPSSDFSKMTEEARQKYYDNFLHHYEVFSWQVNRMVWFGHCNVLDSFVNVGLLTTRHDINCGFINEIAKRLSRIQHRDVVLTLRGDCQITQYEVLSMPDFSSLMKELDRLVERYPTPPECLKENGLSKFKDYIKKLLVHLSPQWQWIMKSSVPLPKTIAPKKPYLRVIELENHGDKIVFIDELRYVLEKLEKRKPDPKGIGCASHFWFIPYFYLEYSLKLFHCTLDDVQIVTTTLPEHDPGMFQPIVGPNGSNISLADNVVFQMIRSYMKQTSEEAKDDLIIAYFPYLTGVYPLPFFAKYHGYSLTDIKQTEYSILEMMRIGSMSKKRSKSEKLEIPEPRVRHLDRDKFKMFREQLGQFSNEVAITAIQIFWRYPQFALVLHQQGLCTETFCYAEMYEVEESFCECSIGEESMKRRVEFALKQDIRNSGQVQAFLNKIGDEYRLNPHVIERIKALEEEKENGVKTRQAPVDELPIRRDSGNSTCSTGSPGPSTSKKLPEPEAKDEETETSSNREEAESAQDESSEADKELDERPDEAARSWGCMLNVMEKENDEKIRKVMKSLNKAQSKNEADRKLIEKQKADIRELKQKMESVGRERKQEVDKLTGDIKRITAEKKKLEDEFEMFRTKNAVVNLERSEIRKLELQLKQQKTQASDSLAEKELELQGLKSEIASLYKINTILESQNNAFVDADAVEKTVVEELEEKNREEIEQMQRFYEEREEKNKAESKDRELQNLKRQSSLLEVQIREVQKLREELTIVKRGFEALEETATPACRAAVKRMAEIKKHQEKAAKDGERFENAENKLEEYYQKDDQFHWHLYDAARDHLKKALAAKKKYEQRLDDNYRTIRGNISRYFTLHDTHVDFVKPYPDPLTPEIIQRMRELDGEPTIETVEMPKKQFVRDFGEYRPHSEFKKYKHRPHRLPEFFD